MKLNIVITGNAGRQEEIAYWFCKHEGYVASGRYDPIIEEVFDKEFQYNGQFYQLNIIAVASQDEYEQIRLQHYRTSHVGVICFKFGSKTSLDCSFIGSYASVRRPAETDLPIVLACDVDDCTGGDLSFDDIKEFSDRFNLPVVFFNRRTGQGVQQVMEEAINVHLAAINMTHARKNALYNVGLLPLCLQPKLNRIEKLYLNTAVCCQPEHQVAFIWKAVEKLLQAEKKVGIVFSTHNKQADLLYQSYYDTQRNPLISKKGSVQAKTFRLLEERIIGMDHGDNIHILPMATSLEEGANEGKNAVSTAIIMRDLINIKQHIEDDWYVLVLANPPELQRNNKGELQIYQINGGLTTLEYEGNVYTQGQFIEHMMYALFHIYNENLSQGVVSLFKPKIEHTFSQYQPELLPTMMSLRHFVRSAFAARGVMSLRSTEVVNVEFDHSYNLHICCANAIVQKYLEAALSDFGSNTLHKLRANELTVSIVYTHAARFLLQYCYVSPLQVARQYNNRIKQDHNYQQVEITAQGICINGRLFALSECMALKKFGQHHNKLLQSGTRNPHYVHYAVSEISKVLTPALPNLSSSWGPSSSTAVAAAAAASPLSASMSSAKRVCANNLSMNDRSSYGGSFFAHQRAACSAIPSADEQRARIFVTAAFKGDIATLKSMLACGTNINAKSQVNNEKAVAATALHWAVKSGNTATIKFLLSRAASQLEPDEDGKAPIEWAPRNRLEEFVNIFDEASRSRLCAC